MEASRQGLLPFGRVFGHVNTRIGSPVNAYLLQYALCLVFIVGLPAGAIYKFIIAFIAYPSNVRIFMFLKTYSIFQHISL
jgi:amino acid transporter